MAKLDIKKKSTDKSTVVGSIVEMNVKRDEEARAPWDSELGKGGYSKAEFKNPMFRIKVEREDGDVIVDMDSFPILDKSRDFKSNNVQDNATAKVIQQLLDMKNDVIGTRVRINGTLTENTFATKEFKIARNEQLQVGWISLNNVPEEDSADTTIAGKIYNIVDEMDGDVETGNKIVILHYVDKAHQEFRINELDLYIDEELFEEFPFEEDDCVTLYVEAFKKHIGGTNESTASTKRRKSSTVVDGYDVQKFRIFNWEDNRIDEDDEQYISEDDRDILLKKRKIELEAKVQKRKEDGDNNDAPKSGLGSRRRRAEVEEIEDDDDENPFG